MIYEYTLIILKFVQRTENKHIGRAPVYVGRRRLRLHPWEGAALQSDENNNSRVDKGEKNHISTCAILGIVMSSSV